MPQKLPGPMMNYFFRIYSVIECWETVLSLSSSLQVYSIRYDVGLGGLGTYMVQQSRGSEGTGTAVIVHVGS